MPPKPASLGIFIVIVLYKIQPADSPSYTTLLSALGLTPNDIRVQVLLYDNTPPANPVTGLPDFVRYVASPVNRGLATAYNLAIDMAEAGGFGWLLTLDQDTQLPATFLQQIAPLASQYQDDLRLAAIVPQVFGGTRILSPHWYAGRVKPRWFPKGFVGIPDKAVYALNSGALLRVRAVREAGGYSPLFWLDASDMALFRAFEQAGKQVFVAGNIALQHDLSLADIGKNMSLARYRNALAAGSALFDLEPGALAGMGQTLVLLHTYLNQVRRKENRAIRMCTLDMIRRRLLFSRKKRLEAWLREQRERIEGWRSQQHAAKPGEPSPADAESTILAVIVLYRMAPEMSAALNSLLAAAAHAADVSFQLNILLYDNTPPENPPQALPPNVSYIASARNVGLSEAYNKAIERAAASGMEWVLTLDQDTTLPEIFLQTVVPIARQVHADQRVAAILPLVKEGDRTLSPHWFKLDFFPQAFSSASHGIQKESVYAFNSGAMLRTRALQTIGGYNPLFWLDYSDAYLFRMLHLFGYKGFVAGTTVIQHHLSLLHAGEMPAARYRNIVQAGSAFCDLYRGPLVGLEFTGKLLRSYLGQFRRRGAGDKKVILAGALRNRLLHPRARRIRAWIRQENARRAGTGS